MAVLPKEKGRRRRRPLPFLYLGAKEIAAVAASEVADWTEDPMPVLAPVVWMPA
jgi:hypothetical protein